MYAQILSQSWENYGYYLFFFVSFAFLLNTVSTVKQTK